MMKKANGEWKKRSVTGRKSQAQICSACVCKKVFQFCPRGLRGAHLSHVFLDRACADAQTQLEQFAPDPFRSPQAVVPSHVLDQCHDLCGYLWFGRSCPGLVFPIESASLAMPAQKCLWLNDEQGLFPGPNGSCQKDQEHPVGPLEDRSFDVSAEDDQLLSEEGVFCHELGPASGKICDRSQQERGGGVWFGPVDEAMVKRLNVKSCQPFDEEKNPMHSLGYPFMKMSR
jgi:hypothetical protein